MPAIEIIGSGRIDDRDSAFPQTVVLPNGDILCSLSVGGGPNAEGGTELYRSSDAGRTWEHGGAILSATDSPRTSNCLRISMSCCGSRLYAYGSRFYREPDAKFGEGRNEPVLCISDDFGSTWSPPSVIPMPCAGPFEISHSILVLANGRLLAPAATLPSKNRLGESVLTAVSEDGGETWHRHVQVFRDPEGKLGFFEHKLTEYAPDRLMAVCWTVNMSDVSDQPNSFALSDNGGMSWTPFCSTGIYGQTMTPIPIAEDRLLVLYNRRYGRQGIYMALVSFSACDWVVQKESILYDAGREREKPVGLASGVAEFDAFMFGFPTAVRLPDKTFLATYWSKEKGRFGVNWAKLSVQW